MKDVLHKREPAFLHRNAKRNGSLAADSLAACQPEKKAPKDFKNGHFRFNPSKRHLHRWLVGATHACCAECGKTVPKNEVLNSQLSTPQLSTDK